MDVQIKTLDSQRVAFVRHVGPYDQCKAAWGKLCSHPAVCQTMGPNTLAIGICYDDPDVTDDTKIRYDACFTVGDQFQPGDGVQVQTIEGGQYAVMVHTGSYDGLHDCYRWFFGQWLPESGREARSAPSLEVYRNSPEDTAPEELVTELRVPLEAKP